MNYPRKDLFKLALDGGIEKVEWAVMSMGPATMTQTMPVLRVEDVFLPSLCPLLPCLPSQRKAQIAAAALSAAVSFPDAPRDDVPH